MVKVKCKGKRKKPQRHKPRGLLPAGAGAGQDNGLSDGWRATEGKQRSRMPFCALCVFEFLLLLQIFEQMAGKGV